MSSADLEPYRGSSFPKVNSADFMGDLASYQHLTSSPRSDTCINIKRRSCVSLDSRVSSIVARQLCTKIVDAVAVTGQSGVGCDEVHDVSTLGDNPAVYYKPECCNLDATTPSEVHSGRVNSYIYFVNYFLCEEDKV